MILRQVPDLPPRPLTRANAGFRRWFYERWGHENAAIVYRTNQAEFPPYTQTLSIKRAWGGTEDYLVGARRLAVGDTHGLRSSRACWLACALGKPTRRGSRNNCKACCGRCCAPSRAGARAACACKA